MPNEKFITMEELCNSTYGKFSRYVLTVDLASYFKTKSFQEYLKKIRTTTNKGTSDD